MYSRSQCLTVCIACLMVLPLAPRVVAQAQPAAELTRDQEKMASAFARGRIPASEEAKRALIMKIKLEMDTLKAPPAKNLEDAQALARLADVRANIDSIWISGAKDPTARQIAARAVAVYGGQILKEQVSPQTKINCMAMLAELDEAPAAGTSPPTPSADAFNILFSYAGNENAPVYLRAIALHGMNRHIGRWWPTTNWPDNGRALIESTLTTIVNSEPKNALDLKNHAWLVRRAYDCLSTMSSPNGAPSALNRLADPKALPSLRLSALEYLSRLDVSGFPEDKKALYLIGLAHFARSQLVNWYEKEDDILKAKSGVMGGMAGMSGMSGGPGMSMGPSRDDEMGMDLEAAYASSGFGGGSTGNNKNKPIDTQTWQVRLSRRLINQISQAVHLSLDGVPLPEVTALAEIKPLKDAKLPEKSQAKIASFVELIEEFQTAVNDPAAVKDMTSLLTQAEGRIEEIMDFVKEVPGFLERYPELAPDDELQTATAPSESENIEGENVDAPVDAEAPLAPAASEPPAPAAPAAAAAVGAAN